MYFKIFTDNDVMLVQSRFREDVQHWMQREYGRKPDQYALISIDARQVETAVNVGVDLMVVPADQATDQPNHALTQSANEEFWQIINSEGVMIPEFKSAIQFKRPSEELIYTLN